MSMITCPECGRQISDKAQNCPNCGAPVEKKIICEECGTELDKDAKACPNCGAPVTKPSQNTTITISGNTGKSKTVFAILALFLGYFGIQYFYVGKNKAGIVFLLVTILGSVIYLGPAFTCIVSLVQFISCLLMTQEKFESAFVNTPADKIPLFG